MKPKISFLIFLIRVPILLIFLSISSLHLSASSSLHAERLRCEYLKNPDGIDCKSPRLFWRMAAGEKSDSEATQSAYQIVVSSSCELIKKHKGDVWDSGKITSSSSTHIVYQGKRLEPFRKYWWSVLVWDQNGKKGEWSEPATWSMGPDKWKAQWIGEEPDTALYSYLNYVKQHYADSDFDYNVWISPPTLPSPHIRKSFNVNKKVTNAFLYATALGNYEIRINGKKPDAQRLHAPEISNYDRLLQYQTYDVTPLLQKGENIVSAVLSDGWALGRNATIKWMRNVPHRGFYSPDRRLLAQLVITFNDGSLEIIPTDGSWKIDSDGSDVRDADNFAGETIDGRLADSEWMRPGFNDSNWKSVTVDNSIHDRKIAAQQNEPIRIVDTYRPKKIWKHNGNTIVDFGQNIAGHCRLSWKGETGDTITIRHGEWIDDDGSVYTRSLGYAKSSDKFILSGKEDLFEPTYTYHGFQFAELSGLDHDLDCNDIEAVSISSDVKQTGTFECSNPLVNKLFSNILHTQRNNMISILHDNPSRDERTGAAGDVQIFAQSAIFNMDMAAFLSKYMTDFMETAENGEFYSMIPPLSKKGVWNGWIGAPGWSEAGLIIPWRLFENYGDTTVLSRLYPFMKSHVETILRENPDYIWRIRHNHNGDWLNANTLSNPPDPTYSTTRGATPDDLFATAFFAEATRLLSEIAAVINVKEDIIRYQELYKKIKNKFVDSFIREDGSIEGDTQGTYSLSLAFGLVPDHLKSKAYSHLLNCIKEYDNRLSTGFISTPLMMQLLTDNNNNELAYTLLESNRFPSWLYNVENGATTIWERWDSWVPKRGFQNSGMNSLDHVAFGSVAEWIYRNILGINPDIVEPGFKHFILTPKPGGSLTWAKGSYDSIHGIIESYWEKNPLTGEINYHLTVPPNTSATLILETTSPDKFIGSYASFSKVGNRKVSTELKPGKYNFKAEL